MRLVIPLVVPSPLAGAPVRTERSDLVHNGTIVRLSDPRMSPDARSVVLVASRANDGPSGGLWIQPFNGPAVKVAVGSAVPAPGVAVSRSGQMALLASEPDRRSESRG